MIRIEGLHKRYGSQDVLKGVSFNIRKGSVTAVMGLSGSGKSVLMRHIIGLEQPDSGAIVIDGENIVTMKPRDLNRIRRRFGVLFQEGALFDSLSVKENVAFPVREHLNFADSKVLEIVEEKLAKVGMKDHQDKFPAELSGGMRKRVALARALALEPEIVFFDEPTTGLDPITKAAIYRLIEETHLESSGTYVVVSHDIEGILNISDDVVMLLKGKIAVQGDPAAILDSSDPAVRQFVTGSSDGPITID
ncbi:MAG: ABC transporter ATP-binding protein [Deltaproteobacteria bacterium]|jgi:phospholipid/cholesterol/gamma-HCH transport system ATP-binding protein|nr:ABC transporter ATP-binding protein [Deltaproteobacteria bacterium]